MSVSGAHRPPKRELLGQAVAALIRERILRGEIRAGERLGLAVLAEQMEMSITPVREALLQLAQDGWLVHRAHRGFEVVSMREVDVRDTYTMWAHAEGELASRAAAVVDPAGVAALRRADQRLRDLDDHGTAHALALNRDLHDTVHEIADAPKLVWFAQAAMRLVPLDFSEIFNSVHGWSDVNRYGHTAIIDAIEAHDAERASELMAGHFRATGDLLIAELGSKGFWAAEGDVDDGKAAS
jgi:DNA-binding GntR family transcriptional regulator